MRTKKSSIIRFRLIFLAFVFITATVILFVYNPKNKVVEASAEESTSQTVSPTKKALGSDPLKYENTETKFMIAGSDGNFEDKTDDLKQNGYLGKLGDDIKLKIVMSGIKYKEDFFDYSIEGNGGKIKWGSWYTTQHYKYDGCKDYELGLGEITSTTQTFSADRGRTFCYNVSVNANVSMTLSIYSEADSIYNYSRILIFYNSPSSTLQLNDSINKTISPGDNYKTVEKTKNHQQVYKSFYNLWGCANGYWDCIAQYYDNLVTHHNTNISLDFIRNVPESSEPSVAKITPSFPTPGSEYRAGHRYQLRQEVLDEATEDWINADNNAKNELSSTSIVNNDNNCLYTSSSEVNLKDIKNPINDAGKYQIYIDSGKAKSEPLNVYMYEIVDNKPLCMRESVNQGDVASDEIKIRIYNSYNTPVKISTGAATAKLDGETVELKNNGYFTPSNVEEFGSSIAMKEMEACIGDSLNLNEKHDNIATIPAKGYTDIGVKIKNANAIYKNADGTLNIPVKLDLGDGNYINGDVSVVLKSEVAQIKVSVPMEIKMYVAQDNSSQDRVGGRNYFSNLNGNNTDENEISGNYIQNLSKFPVDVNVSPFLVTQATSIKDSNNQDYFPNLNNAFSIYLRSTSNEEGIKLLSKGDSSGDMQYTKFATMEPNGDKAYFYFTMNGKISDQFKNGEYKYKSVSYTHLRRRRCPLWLGLPR